MDTTPGTDPLEGGSNDNGWVLLEAEEVGAEGFDEDEDEDDCGEDLVDFIDDSLCEVVQPRDYYRQINLEQQIIEDEKAVHAVKRKFLDSPKSKVDYDLSPRIAAITIQEQQRTARARRKLYKDSINDSGNGDSLEDASAEPVLDRSVQVTKRRSFKGLEVGETATPKGVENEGSSEEGMSEEDYTCSISQLLQAGKPKHVMLALFKENFGCCFSHLTRSFKSDKTVNEDWVITAVGVPCSLSDAISDLLTPHAKFSHVTCTTCKYGLLVLMLVQWNTAKSRETVQNLLGGLFAIKKEQMVLDPPRNRHPAAAMYWYKKSLTRSSIVVGEMPSWILKQICIQEQLEETSPFVLSEMVQWAYDNGFDTESQIAYEYACLADVDKNAEAFLRSNSQAKFVRDCTAMVRLYKRAEMAKMSMSQWIQHRSDKIEGDGDWKPIMKFLKYQNIDILEFLGIFRHFLKGTPKKSCLVIYGPANTGKSLFGMSLITMLGGKVLSFVNSTSQFWLQPLADAKVALLDDATGNTWDYADTYLRNLLDGNPISIDLKHKAHMQVRCPPLIITTNTNILENPKWKYLYSRVKILPFLNECPLDSRGDPVFKLNSANWKAFFKKCWASLTLGEEQEQDGQALQPLRCAARSADGTD
ncbi:E1 [Tursiops truncatus papillomavirus 6]|uniref:Replication protein E1 n=1 Tax=Tursiops truncatus papillomavirus 6 TaxID=1144382 RepID=H6UYP7_PSPV|nr:E1 [Tursiops truncatus papillomavirus 6]